MRYISFIKILIHIFFLRTFIKLFSGITITGKENLQQLDRYIIIANHNSHFDIIVLFCLLPVRDIVRTHAVADKKYFSKYLIVYRLVNFLFNPIWITRGDPGSKSDPLGGIKARIDMGDNIIIFPEGTRGKPGELQPFKSGIGRLMAQCSEIPIVPVYLSGTERALPKSSSLPLPFWNNVTIGPPQVCRGTHRDITQSLESILTELSRSESAHRHKRKHKKKIPPKTVAFLGIDGSGKSTISRMITKELSVSSGACIVSDGLEFYENGMSKEIQPLLTEKLREAIGSYAKKAKSLKRYKIPKLAELLLRNHLLQEAGRWYIPDFIIMDGCPLLNLVAWAALYKKEHFNEDVCSKAIAFLSREDSGIKQNDPIFTHFPELLYLKRLKIYKLMLPDVVVFLDVPPATAYKRITSRDEQKQVHETKEKLGELRNAYLIVCDVIQRNWHIPTSIIDGENTPENIAASGFEFINKYISTGN